MFQLFLLLLEVIYLFLAFKTGNTLFMVIAVGVGAWWLYELNKDAKERSEALLTDTIQKVEQHPHTRYIISPDYLRALMLDERSGMLRILEREDVPDDFEIKEIDFEDIYEIAILEDGQQVALTAKGGVHGLSLIKGGAKMNIQVDELQEEEEEEEEDEVQKLALQLLVDDLYEPLIEYIFLDNEQAIPKELDEYKDIFKECHNWYQKISVIIKRHERKKAQDISIKGWT
ncbi:hypothetical protein D1B33_13755 [Lysinibacillus yapensis]|uniref:Uncharacterized protein n=1 Tax=Ureibacillus yapensis TaxID=2304605 RepID=A0A396S4V3_9BACL|nr:hypothetical protein [Lysinibacillus yapensis]RHW34710.1 hypothetical protein D1B33_13755 [Lysinibacillus yapensis]